MGVEAPGSTRGRRSGPWARAAGPALGFAVLLGVLTWAHRDALTLLPTTTDGVLWLTESIPTNRGWLGWTFLTRHFDVGYRPLVALSYTTTYLLGGLQPLPHHLTDIVFHCAAAVLVGVLFRRLLPALPRWSAWLAAAYFALHPLTIEVVSLVARRSYSLATLLGLAGIILALPKAAVSTTSTQAMPVDRRATPRTLGAAILLASSVLCNEVGFVTVAALPWLQAAVAGTDRRRAVLRGTFVALAVCTVALGSRTLAIGELGGYTVAGAETTRALLVPLRFWRDLAATTTWSAWPALTTVIVVAAAVVLALQAAGSLLRARSSASARVAVAVIVWLCGYALLYLMLGVWFSRQGYPALVPLALLLGWSAAQVGHGVTGTGDGRARHTLHVLVCLFLGSALLGWWPADTSGAHRAAQRDRRHDLLVDVVARGRETPRNARIFLVLAQERVGGDGSVLHPWSSEQRTRRWTRHAPGAWATAVLRRRNVDVRYLLAYRPLRGDAVETPDFIVRPRGAVLQLGPRQKAWMLGRGRLRPEAEPHAIELSGKIGGRRRPTFLYIQGGGSSELHRIRAPSKPRGKARRGGRDVGATQASEAGTVF